MPWRYEHSIWILPVQGDYSYQICDHISCPNTLSISRRRLFEFHYALSEPEAAGLSMSRRRLFRISLCVVRTRGCRSAILIITHSHRQTPEYTFRRHRNLSSFGKATLRQMASRLQLPSRQGPKLYLHLLQASTFALLCQDAVVQPSVRSQRDSFFREF
jgi:hypothetical protein